jgi:hypothetical protein
MSNKKIVAEFTEFNNNENWCHGTCEGTTFSAKLFDNGSDFGINDGRVSKLSIHDKKLGTICNYDRGWDIPPKEGFQRQYNAIMHLLENAPKRFS